MAAVGDRSLLFVAVAVTGTRSAARTTNAVEDLIDLGLQHGLEHLADPLAAEYLEGTQEIFSTAWQQPPTSGRLSSQRISVLVS
jgi:hypothetical protein